MKRIFLLSIFLASTAQGQSLLEIQSQMKEILSIEAQKVGIPPLLLIELCRDESDLRPWIQGDKKDGIPQSWGLCQLHIETASRISKAPLSWQDLLDPSVNAKNAAGYLKFCHQKTGTWTKAVSCYKIGHNGVPWAGVSGKVIKAWRVAEFGFSAEKKLAEQAGEMERNKKEAQAVWFRQRKGLK